MLHRKLTISVLTLLMFALFGNKATAQSTGKVVINEYMPWTNNSCSPTSEFVELLNFGPGPVDIGCYVLTDGDFAVTIPAGTILQPGEYYVIAGQNVIPRPCANIDSAITVDLNWNNCRCTNAPIPTTGEGWFTDGGTAREQVVLLDPGGTVLDAVIRSLPAEPSSLITTNDLSGGCGALDFDLDNMSFNYEVLGMSTGRGNSFARKLDGDCGWLKDPQQSANATNNTPGDESDITYTFNYVHSQDCGTVRGSIAITVEHADLNSVFPMSYTLVYDSDNSGTFDMSDTYTYGTDDTPPTLLVDGLTVGRYRITLASVMGCYLKSLDFAILTCTPTLPVSLVYFKLVQRATQNQTFEWKITEAEGLATAVLERSSDGRNFVPETAVQGTGQQGTMILKQTVAIRPSSNLYRLRMISHDGKVTYSNIINVSDKKEITANIWPNPAQDRLNVELMATARESASYRIFNMASQTALEGRMSLNAGLNTVSLPLENLPKGVYQLVIARNTANGQPISFRFVKQ